MPEGDTVWRTARRLDQALTGRPLIALELRWGDLGGRDLLPATTITVISRGKHLLHRLDTGTTVHTHLKMEGSWQVAASARLTASRLRDPDLRAVAGTGEWTALGLRLGLVELWPTRDEPVRLAHLGPDLLGPDWDLDRALGNLRRDDAQAIGAALLDQRNLAGIGTFWASEGLHLLRQSPWSPVGAVDEQDLARLVTAIRGLMQRAAQTGIQSSTGVTARGRTSYVHARSGRPCRGCGQQVRVAPIGAPPRRRVMFYCPTCQAGLAPGDDGRPVRPLGTSRH